MKRLLAGLFVCVASTFASSGDAQQDHPESFLRALELIHAFTGAGDEPKRAEEIGRALRKSHPGGGYAQTLEAEWLSTWELGQDGSPPDLFKHILQLTDEALRLNPRLAYAYLPRARALLRASRYDEAGAAIETALKLDPNLLGAFFLRAEIHRKKLQVDEAVIWYIKFIEGSSSPARKANAYYWMGTLYQEAAWARPREWDALIAKARQSFEKEIELEPKGAWRNVNFAAFLNDEGADFAAAERYAQIALSAMEFPMARYHLAIARYQKLLAQMSGMSDESLRAAVVAIQQSTRITLQAAIEFAEENGYLGIPNRLAKIRDRVRPAKKAQPA